MDGSPGEITIEILKQIRDEIRTARLDLTAEIRRTNERMDVTNQRLDATNERQERLEHRQVEAETRLATEVHGVHSAIVELRDVLLADRRLRRQVFDHERRICALEHGRKE